MSNAESPLGASSFLGHSSYRSPHSGLNPFATEIDHLTTKNEWDYEPTDHLPQLADYRLGALALSMSVENETEE